VKHLSTKRSQYQQGSIRKVPKAKEWVVEAAQDEVNELMYPMVEPWFTWIPLADEPAGTTSVSGLAC